MKIKLEPGAQMPKKAHESDAAYDMFAYEETAIAPHDRAIIRTGISMAIDAGYFGDIRPRSSYFSKGVDVSGVIDSGYRGEVKVMMQNHSNAYLHIKKGERIAQIIIMPTHTQNFEIVEDLPQSDRGTGGFGSSGK